MLNELINHLWRSMLFAILVGLLTFAFRRNRAEVRYWLWFSASFKFFVPFSLLMGPGVIFGRKLFASSMSPVTSVFNF
jgi:hypothetical protein